MFKDLSTLCAVAQFLILEHPSFAKKKKASFHPFVKTAKIIIFLCQYRYLNSVPEAFRPNSPHAPCANPNQRRILHKDLHVPTAVYLRVHVVTHAVAATEVKL